MKHLLLIILIGQFALNVTSQDNFEITIDRSSYSDDCIGGYLFINDSPICYTLELPWKENNNKVSSIPVGSYAAILRYDHSDKWRIELLDVPNRTNIQIHIGNYTSDTKGCILVGTEINGCSVYDSKNSYYALKKSFYGSDNPNSTPNKNIIIHINN